METEITYFLFILKVCCKGSYREKVVKYTGGKKKTIDSSRSQGRWEELKS